MRSRQEYIDVGETVFYKTYNRFPVIFERGDGVRLYDTEGNEYLDFGAGIAVSGLGYHHAEFCEAVKSQVDKLMHTSNLFYNVPSIEAGEKLIEASGMEKVFFTNSGTEAIEGAVKIAKRYGFNKDGRHDHEIIAMKNSFHGRSIGALSVTGNMHYQEPFLPLLPGIRFADFNDLDSVKALVNEKTCAIILETVQGEGGIYPASKCFLEGIYGVCREHGILFMLDEIQCGMGRCGSMFAWQEYGIRPDVMTTAKALGNGVPVGAFLASGDAAASMVPGDHGTTYGGNPLAAAAVSAVFNLFEKHRIVEHVKEISVYLWKRLDELVNTCDMVLEHRGMGLLQGLEFSIPVAPVIHNALIDQRLVLIAAGNHVIRFVPPLVIGKQDVDEMIVKLKKAIEAVH